MLLCKTGDRTAQRRKKWWSVQDETKVPRPTRVTPSSGGASLHPVFKKVDVSGAKDFAIVDHLE